MQKGSASVREETGGQRVIRAWHWPWVEHVCRGHQRRAANRTTVDREVKGHSDRVTDPVSTGHCNAGAITQHIAELLTSHHQTTCTHTTQTNASVSEWASECSQSGQQPSVTGSEWCWEIPSNEWEENQMRGWVIPQLPHFTHTGTVYSPWFVYSQWHCLLTLALFIHHGLFTRNGIVYYHWHYLLIMVCLLAMALFTNTGIVYSPWFVYSPWHCLLPLALFTHHGLFTRNGIVYSHWHCLLTMVCLLTMALLRWNSGYCMTSSGKWLTAKSASSAYTHDKAQMVFN